MIKLWINFHEGCHFGVFEIFLNRGNLSFDNQYSSIAEKTDMSSRNLKSKSGELTPIQDDGSWYESSSSQSGSISHRSGSVDSSTLKSKLSKSVSSKSSSRSEKRESPSLTRVKSASSKGATGQTLELKTVSRKTGSKVEVRVPSASSSSHSNRELERSFEAETKKVKKAKTTEKVVQNLKDQLWEEYLDEIEFQDEARETTNRSGRAMGLRPQTTDRSKLGLSGTNAKIKKKWVFFFPRVTSFP